MKNHGETASRPRGRPFKGDDEREVMKNHIAETAKNLFQDEGYARVSIRRLAKESGCSPMTLYKYYDGKIAILQTLWAVVFDALFATMRKQLADERDPVKRLQMSCRLYVGYWLKHPEHYRLVFMAEGITQPEVSMFVESPSIGAGFTLFAEIITAALDGTDDEAAIKVTIDLVLASLQGIAHSKITIGGYPWSQADEMIDHLIENII